VEHLLRACETMKELKISQNKIKRGKRLGMKYNLKGNKILWVEFSEKQTKKKKKFLNFTWNFTASFTNSQLYTKS
jgi:hypothetical protein